jgi:8-oxo-dGTP pyrophosphatase MutT (NUDIX family)
MNIQKRVRAILINRNNEIVLLKRVRESFQPYWITPGGGVEASDSSYEAALTRELREEIGGTADIIRPVLMIEHLLEEDFVVHQWFYLCYLLGYNFEKRSGPELLTGQGSYQIETVPLKAECLRSLNIQPEKLKSFLIANCEQMMALPAIRF